jgi:hypothetical protein
LVGTRRFSWLAGWLVIRLGGPAFHKMGERSEAWIYCAVGRYTLLDLLIGALVGYMNGWLVGLVGFCWLVCWLVGVLAGWLA